MNEKTINRINNIRKSEPVRKVRSNTRNVPGFFSSKKMKLTIQYESQLELCGVYEYELSDSTVEFYDQPDQLKLDYYQANGKRVAFLYTPDYCVLNHKSVGFEEWKPVEQLEKLCEEDPARYFKDEQGVWRSPPAEKSAGEIGFYYKIRTDREINISLQRNLRFLKDFYSRVDQMVPIKSENFVTALVDEHPGIKLYDVIEACSKEKISSDNVFLLIAKGKIFTDLNRHSLAEGAYVPLYRDRDLALAYEIIHTAPATTTFTKVNLSIGMKILWNGLTWIVINPGESEVTLRNNGDLVDLPAETFEKYLLTGKIKGVASSDSKSKLYQIIKEASKEALTVANYRIGVVRKYINGDNDFVSPLRTVRDWLTKFRKAEQTHGVGYGYIGLIPRDKDKGNRNPKLPEQTLTLMEQAIEEKYETIKRKRRWHVHGELAKTCEKKGIISPSYKTFTKKVKNRGDYLSTLKREGSKAAYQYEPFYFELGPSVPKHGDRPWEIGHIDHTELDIELICTVTKKNLGRPWASLMIDAHTRRILAVYLSFDPPSYRSCMMLLRECVRRHSRLPETIVVDGGKEFQGVYFESLLALYGRNKKLRPAGKPRFGSVIERIFGTNNTQFIYNLLGNTQSTREARKMTKKVNPKLHAVWTLPRFYERFCHYCYEIYDVLNHSTLHQSPRDSYAIAMERTGERFNTIIHYDDLFHFMSMPSTSSGYAKNEPGRGFKCNYIYYSSDALRGSSIQKERLQIRFDPFNMGTAYAYIRNRWVECYSPYRFNVFHGRTEKEIKIATTIIKQQNKLQGKKNEINQKILAEFLEECEEEEILLQQLKDAELKRTMLALSTTVPQSNLSEYVMDETSIDMNKIEILEVL